MTGRLKEIYGFIKNVKEMRNKLSIILIVLSLNLSGQIPNNEVFSFWDIADDFGRTHSSSFNLDHAFEDDTVEYFDSRYYPHYLVTGNHYLVENSMLNFRNYKGTPDGIPIPVATDATEVGSTIFIANWINSVGATNIHIDVSLASNFSSFVSGYSDYEVTFYENEFEYVGGYGASALYVGVTYYYRVRAVAPNGESGNSNVISYTLPFWDNPEDIHDWYLPSLNELIDIYSNTPWVDFGLHGVVWSSTPSFIPDDKYARGMLFGFGDGPYLILSDHIVRAMRTFDSTDIYNIGDTGPAGGYIVKRTPIIPLGTWTYKEIAPSDQSIAANWTEAQTICNNL